MGKTTNILDLNNRLEKVEKENVAQNNYNSLKNRPKINGNLLTGDKTGTQLGLANAQDIGNLSDLNTTDKSSAVVAINEVDGGLTDLKNDILFGELPSNGFDPLTQCSGFFCYSVYPDKMLLQGCPNNYSDYGTIFGCSGTRYKLLVYIDINGKFAVMSQGNAWVTYSN